MALSTQIKNDIEGSIVINDGTGTPLTKTASFVRGDLVYGPFKKVMNEDVIFETRGVFKGVGHGARIYGAGSFSAWFTEFTHASGTIADMILGTGTAYSAAVSTLGANARKLAHQIVLTVEGTDLGDDADGVLTINDCVIQIDQFSEAREGNFLAISWVTYGSTTGFATSGLS